LLLLFACGHQAWRNIRQLVLPLFLVLRRPDVSCCCRHLIVANRMTFKDFISLGRRSINALTAAF